MSIKLKRFLSKEEHVDHKDEDKTNDSLDNLQILTFAENMKKQHDHRRKISGKGPSFAILTCPICDKDMVKRISVFLKAREEDRVLTCSRKCSAKCQGLGISVKATKKKTIDVIKAGLIVNLRQEGNSDLTISKLIGIPRSSIQQYRKENNIK